MTLPPPTDIISKTGEKRVIDGLTYEFLYAPGSEAPAEMMYYIKEKKALNTAEDSPTPCTTPTHCAARRSVSRCPG